jgi:uncharacterized protein (UPF0276 family)
LNRINQIDYSQKAGLNAADHVARPALAATYEGGEPLLLEQMLPLVDYLEISPDSVSQMTNAGSALNPDVMAELKNAAHEVKFLVHGVGLSIASADGYSETYMRLLDEIFAQLPVAWHSEHLAYTMVDGEHLGTMLPPPRTQEAMDMLCGRIALIQERFPVPFLLENVVRFLPDYPGEYSEAEFLNQLSQNTGCGFVLDVYNLECDQENFGFGVEEFLRCLNLSRVMEMHVAGGVRDLGFRLDVHSRITADSTRVLAREILTQAPNVQAVTFEFLKEAVPNLGYPAICSELQRLRENLLHGPVAWIR